MRRFLILTALAVSQIAVVACSSDGGSSNPSSTGISNGQAVNVASEALESVGSSVSGSSLSVNVTPFGGVANDYCTSTGAPKDGSEMDDSDTGVSAADGYCQTTFNSQSPDTARGAMYIAGGMLCEASEQGLFSGLGEGESASVTTSIVPSTTCWGSEEEVEAFIDDIGEDSIDDVVLTVTDLTDGAYDFKLEFEIPGEGSIVVHVKNSDGTIAALSSDGWAFNFDTDEGVLLYESIDTTNNRRVRLSVEGNLAADGTYEEVDSIKGFHMESTVLYTFTGDLEVGLLGNIYGTGVTPDREDECLLPGGTGTCTGLTSISSNDTEATALKNDAADAEDNLVAYTDELISFTTVDPGDTDITE